MRIVMVGAGSVARRHVEVLDGLGARVTGVVDPAPGAADALAGDCGATAHASVAQALDAERPDAAYVCVPPFAHGPAEREVLARGLPLFVEKPLGTGLTEAEELARLVEEADVVTGTGYHWRCLDHLGTVRERLTQSPPLLAGGYWLDKRPPVAWWGSLERSGGQVVEQLTHVLDLARVLLGEPVEVYAAGVRHHDAADAADAVDDATAATVRFASPTGTATVATFAATSLLRAKRRAALHAYGPGYAVEVDETGAVWDDGAGTEELAPTEDPRVAVDREFLEAVRGERAGTRAPYAEALRTHRLACALAESARSGTPVRLDPGPAA